MKKKNPKNLRLNKTQVSNFTASKIKGGSITTFRFICTNHPTQDTDFCPPGGTFFGTCACVTENNEHSCDCSVA
ncbi:hypothetical protein [uncultured Kordia sp.]|uniref:hypothetical protein n=1 Tax=uncultured Kordia sp. TaxID=507699 RepID=UPI00261BA25C|nr:hypothetical protein [uncultured Kordia sp.]